MLINLFQTIRSSGVPCTLRELLDLLGALENQLVYANIDDFYYLSRTILVKDEKHFDKFDKAFDIYFKGIERMEDIFQALIPEDWLRKAFEKELDPEELKKIKSLGGLEKLLDEFKKRLEEQKDRHEVGILEQSEGADVVFPGGWVNREGDPLPMIIRKADGGYNYSTSDLACIIDRVERMGCDGFLYVVGTPQKQHFEMVFQVAIQAGFMDEDHQVTHVN